uniref:Eukaryotic translation initiation factor 2A n=1 Tax=Physcomitrium patens TaxID=3218 RepID=A0A7I4FRM4_PHYPA
MATVPPLKFTVRDPNGLSLLTGPPFSGEPAATFENLGRIPCSASKFSNDGSKLAVTTPNALVIYDTDSGKELIQIPAAGVASAVFSPLGTYLQTFQKPQGQQKNLVLWDSKTGSIVLQQFQKAISKTSWPVIQFSDDESVACRLVTNEVHIFDGHDFSKGIIDRLRLPGIDGVQLAHSPASHIAAYVPEIKGAPANVRIFELANVSQAQSVARRSFFKSNTAQLSWNKGSTGLLVLAQSDVDKTNQNYYGESRLHYLTSDGRHEGAVPLSKEGPIYDVQWSPNGKEFLVVYGFMPAKVTLFNVQCKPLFEFGQGPYNYLRWNPQGSFICLAGFGNLPGDVAFWDRESLKCFHTLKAPVTVTAEWSPDGRYFMTATTAPRLQVDNGFKVFKYDGTPHYEKKYDKLYQAEWRPASSDVYPDRPPSPGARKLESKVEAPKTVQPRTGTKPGAYRPPHAGQAASVKAQLLGLDETSKASTGSSAGLSKSALKNQKRRQKKKEGADS